MTKINPYWAHRLSLSLSLSLSRSLALYFIRMVGWNVLQSIRTVALLHSRVKICELCPTPPSSKQTPVGTPVPHRDLSDFYEKMSGKRASASGVHHSRG